MSIDAKRVQELRRCTSLGMMDCKKALVEADGDFDKAFEIVRKKGLAKASSKLDRQAREGYVAVVSDSSSAVVLSAYCETDFSAMNQIFRDTVSSITKNVYEAQSRYFDQEGQFVESFRDELTEDLRVVGAQIGENVVLGQIRYVQAPFLSFYQHFNGKQVAVVAFSSEPSSDLVELLPMQVASMSPEYVSSDQISQETLDSYVRENKVDGGLSSDEDLISSFCVQKCLLSQSSIIGGEKIEDLVQGVEVLSFVRIVI